MCHDQFTLGAAETQTLPLSLTYPLRRNSPHSPINKVSPNIEESLSGRIKARAHQFPVVPAWTTNDRQKKTTRAGPFVQVFERGTNSSPKPGSAALAQLPLSRIPPTLIIPTRKHPRFLVADRCPRMHLLRTTLVLSSGTTL